MSPHRSNEMLMLGDSAPMRALRREIELVGRSEVPILVSGETGVGKELAATAIHRASGRAGAFVPVNGCTSSETMFDSAVFGHEPGAFTGAIGRRLGYLSEADLGTLFLDEVCSLPLESQAKLLRAVETGKFRRLGAGNDVSSRFRVISASNRDLEIEVEAGRFRMDLFHRLRGFEIVVPPLRDRVDDVPVLFRHYLDAFDRDYEAPREYDDSALEYLALHLWPGNVRELRHSAQCAALRARGATKLRREHLSANARSVTRSTAIAISVESDEAVLLRQALIRHDWSTVTVAEELQVSRKTIYERMRRFGIKPQGRNTSRNGRRRELQLVN
jgi:DNA-binding NtrC family response regulator